MAWLGEAELDLELADAVQDSVRERRCGEEDAG
jgi:hypothetical protein